MSTSPVPTHTAKRPLEEASSPSRNDQPDAKRPALDKVIKNDHEEIDTVLEGHGDALPTPPTAAVESNGVLQTNGQKPEGQDEDANVPDAPEETKPIVSTATGSVPQLPGNTSQNNDETAWIHIRALISSPEAATVIGKGGENVSKIRQISGAKCTVSDYQKGAVERILTVSGVVDAAAKVNHP